MDWSFDWSKYELGKSFSFYIIKVVYFSNKTTILSLFSKHFVRKYINFSEKVDSYGYQSTKVGGFQVHWNFSVCNHRNIESFFFLQAELKASFLCQVWCAISCRARENSWIHVVMEYSTDYGRIMSRFQFFCG